MSAGGKATTFGDETSGLPEAAPSTGGRQEQHTGEEAGIELRVTIDAGSTQLTVLEAQYTGAGDPLAAEVLDTMCKIIVGRPLQEAADHGAIYAVKALSERAAKVPGILTPRNAGAQFALAERLIRRVHASATGPAQPGPRNNAWHLAPARDWVAKSEAEQADVLKPVIAEFLSQKGLAGGDLWISRIERRIRVTVAFSDAVDYAAKPGLLMELERRLRDVAGNPIELFMEELKDANKIRRL